MLLIKKNLAIIFDFITRVRNKLFDIGWISTYRSKLPVISIGNLTVGGNGKTPLAMHIAKLMIENNCRPIILTRGYKSKVKTPHLVQASDQASLVGDEALMMSRNSEALVLVEPDRVQGAKFIESQNLADLIILDDAFQHRYLERNLNLLAIDVTTKKIRDEFLTASLMPLGRFRENLQYGLKRADGIVLVNRSLSSIEGGLDQFVRSLNFTKSIFYSQLSVIGVKHSVNFKSLPPQKILAFCGLASPEAFFISLEQLGYEILHREVFPDHYSFGASDIQSLRKKAGNLPMVCTSKDFVKLENFSDQNLYILQTELNIVEGQKFKEFIKQQLS